MVYAQIGAGVGSACERIVVFTFGDNRDFKTHVFIKWRALFSTVNGSEMIRLK